MEKQLIWVGSSLKDLRGFPDEVKDIMGYALGKVQAGETPDNAKPMKEFKPKVMEIVSNYDTNTYRAMYTVRIGHKVYVLHCFQKKSHKGIKTPKQDVDLIKQRLQEAEKINKLKER